VKLKWDGYYKKLGSSARAFMITGCSPFTRFTKFKANIFVQKTMAVLHVSPPPLLLYRSLTDEAASCDWTVMKNEQEWMGKKAVAAWFRSLFCCFLGVMTKTVQNIRIVGVPYKFLIRHHPHSR
jgi:hypothetical protein